MLSLDEIEHLSPLSSVNLLIEPSPSPWYVYRLGNLLPTMKTTWSPGNTAPGSDLFVRRTLSLPLLSKGLALLHRSQAILLVGDTQVGCLKAPGVEGGSAGKCVGTEDFQPLKGVGREQGL